MPEARSCLDGAQRLTRFPAHFSVSLSPWHILCVSSVHVSSCGSESASLSHGASPTGGNNVEIHELQRYASCPLSVTSWSTESLGQS